MITTAYTPGQEVHVLRIISSCGNADVTTLSEARIIRRLASGEYEVEFLITGKRIVSEDDIQQNTKGRSLPSAAYYQWDRKNPTYENRTDLINASQKYIKARDYYTSKWPRHV